MGNQNYPISKFATTLSFSGPNSQVSLCYFFYPPQPFTDPNGFLKKRMLMFNPTYLKQKFEFLLHATTKTEQRQQIPPQRFFPPTNAGIGVEFELVRERNSDS